MDFDFKSILDLVKAFPDENTCMAYLAESRWNGVVVSPFDVTSKVYVTARGYKCKNTGKYFNAKVGTIFEDTKIPLIKWFMALYIFSSHKKGISSHQLSKDIDVTQKTAWFMLHRLRFAFNTPSFKAKFDGIVEIDETFIGGDGKNKHASKKENPNKRGPKKGTHAPVLGIKDRETGFVKAAAISEVVITEVIPYIYHNVEAGSIICTDEAPLYKRVRNDFNHQTVNHRSKEYINGMCHTNGIENFWSHLKRGIDGIYHWVSREHLNAYVNEFTLRYNTRKMTTSGRFDMVLANVAGRLTYKELTK